MKQEILKLKKGTKGITLVALVVTIVVLLILAGITISTLFGDNGIITAARKAAEETKAGENDTDSKLGGLGDSINDILNGISIVEPKNIEDWEYELDKATNTIAIKKYKGRDTEVVIPNYIGGVKVKSVGMGLDTKTSKYANLWDSSICTSNNTPYAIRLFSRNYNKSYHIRRNRRNKRILF